jgi:hypothetical protein
MLFDAAGQLNSMLDSIVSPEQVVQPQIGTSTMRPQNCDLLVDNATVLTSREEKRINSGRKVLNWSQAIMPRDRFVSGVRLASE